MEILHGIESKTLGLRKELFSSASGFRVVQRSVRHRVIGENQLPHEVWVDDLETAIALLGKEREVGLFLALLKQTEEQLPQLLAWIEQQPLKALALEKIWPKVLAFVQWRLQHPNPQIYLRQVNLTSIDSKFIEQNRAVLASLLDSVLPAEQVNDHFRGSKQFERRYGFCCKPERVRFRLLDPMLSLLLGGDGDLMITADDFQALEQMGDFVTQIQRVFITENEINFLTFPERKNSLVIFGSGYGFSGLAQVSWLAHKPMVYWGDIDTHGFAILDQLRGKFPQVRSLLMDEQTLLAHRAFWGVEGKPERRALAHLTESEQSVYQQLLSNRHGQNVRLEQERIGFDYLLLALE